MPSLKRRKLSHDLLEPHQSSSRPLKDQIQALNANNFRPSSRNQTKDKCSSSGVSDHSPDPPTDEDEGFREDDEVSDRQSSEKDSTTDFSDDEDEKRESVDEASGDDNDMKKQQNELRSISFGALADAQDSISKTSPLKASSAGESNTNKKNALTALRNLTRPAKTSVDVKRKAQDTQSRTRDKTQRVSKHAPTEQSSKRPVTRRREAIDTSHMFDANAQNWKIQSDPRFNAAVGFVDYEKVRKNYAFLNEYAEKELQDLKTTLDEGKKRKRGKMSEEEQAEMRKEIGRRENRIKAKAQKEKEREIAQRHKKEERAKVKEGKQPFFLKRGKLKQEAQSQVWEGMKAKEKQKAEQRRRRRQDQKEMKQKPGERRVRES